MSIGVRMAQVAYDKGRKAYERYLMTGQEPTNPYRFTKSGYGRFNAWEDGRADAAVEAPRWIYDQQEENELDA